MITLRFYFNSIKRTSKGNISSYGGCNLGGIHMGDRTAIRYYLHKGKYRLAWVPLEKERAQSKNVTRLYQVDKGVLYIQFAPP